MNPLWKEIFWHQIGAAIETLENALNACPDELWRARLWPVPKEVRPEFAEVWYVGYHTIFWIDYYCSDSADGFTVPAPFTNSELETGAVPERVYTKQELQTYLEYARAKCRVKIESLADETERQRVRDNWRVKTVAELLLYTMRHIQEHASQLNMFLGQNTSSAPGWVGQVTIR